MRCHDALRSDLPANERSRERQWIQRPQVDDRNVVPAQQRRGCLPPLCCKLQVLERCSAATCNDVPVLLRLLARQFSPGSPLKFVLCLLFDTHILAGLPDPRLSLFFPFTQPTDHLAPFSLTSPSLVIVPPIERCRTPIPPTRPPTAAGRRSSAAPSSWGAPPPRQGPHRHRVRPPPRPPPPLPPSPPARPIPRADMPTRPSRCWTRTPRTRRRRTRRGRRPSASMFWSGWSPLCFCVPRIITQLE